MPRRRSIAATLTGVNLLVSGVALLLAAAGFGAYDRRSVQQGALRNLSIQAQIVASNSVSALLLNDPSAARSTLSALSAAPNIVAAHIYTPDGRLFARYPERHAGRDPSSPTIPGGQSEVSRIEPDKLVAARRIAIDGRDVGSVAIESNLDEFDTRRMQYLVIVGTVLVASMLAALIVSSLFHRVIARPIVQLASIAKRVSGAKDYSMRAPAAASADEVVVLTDSFNEMLTEIQRRDQSLRDAQHELEERVQQRTAELEAVNQELEAFSYSVSHDLRAPLRHVTGFAALLESHAGEQLDAQSRRYVQTITRAARHMGHLIDDLLAFSRIGRGQLSVRPVDLNALVQDARQEVLSHGGASAPQIEWELESLPEVHADPAMLRLAFVNLLSNAVKYTARRPLARIEIGARDDGGEVVVFVRDNGVGFDMQYAHKLFGVFQRLHRSDEFEGTGIGLANVKRIIHRHGGRVWAESGIDRGATFSFSLPKGHRS